MVVFTPHCDIEKAIKQGRTDLRAYLSVRGNDPDSKWAEWAGSRLSKLKREREAISELFASPESPERLVAASLAAEYWPPNERFTRDAIRLAFEDSEATVRGAALFALVSGRHFIKDSTGWFDAFMNAVFPESCPTCEEQRKAEEIELWAKATKRAMWERQGGSHVGRMLESRASAESYLTHMESDLRCAALMILKDHWGPDSKFIKSCEEIAYNDPDVQVSSMALAVLSGCFIRTDDRRVGELIARLVRDESKPKMLRSTAYSSLLTIRGMPIDDFLAATDSTFPAKVDWAFVDSFLP